MSKNSKKLKCDIQELEEFLKCGEIFHYNGCFRINCTDCDEQLFDYQDFLYHFRIIHCIQGKEILEDVQPLFSPCTTKNVSDLEEFEAATLQSPASLDIKKFSNEEEKKPFENILNSKQTKHSESKKNILLQLRTNHACEKCCKQYATKRGLNKHIQRRHFETKEYSCNQCKEIFQDRTSLWKHERIQHAILACTICKKSYKNRRSLREHLASHNEISSFTCDYQGCEKSFKSQKRLNDHKIAHNPSQAYVCEVCGYRTIRKDTLVQHVRTHTGEKPYSCKICGKHFISSSMVNEHLATHTKERPYVCDICGSSFTRPKALYHHKPLHLGIKKFVCIICDKAYAQASGLSAHMRKHKVNGKIAPGFD